VKQLSRANKLIINGIEYDMEEIKKMIDRPIG
jgi:hypothetical protein